MQPIFSRVAKLKISHISHHHKFLYLKSTFQQNINISPTTLPSTFNYILRKFRQQIIFQICKDLVIYKTINNCYQSQLKIRIPEPSKQNTINSKTNICRQVWIRCIQLTYVTFYGCQYVCSMEKALQLDPCLFSLLEKLQYKALLAKEKSKNSKRADQYRFVSNRYSNDIKAVLQKIKQWKQNPKKLSQKARENIVSQIQQISKQSLGSLSIEDVEYDRQKVRNQVSLLQSQLADFYIHRLNSLHKDVTDYFQKYWNKQVKQQYMRLLSSPENEDHGKALTNFWTQAKQLNQFPEHIEQAVVMYFNYFLEYVHDPLKITAIKILCMLFRNNGLKYQIYFVYERLLFNLYCQLSDQSKQQLFSVSLKCIYTLFQKVPDNLFIQALLNPQHSVKLRTRIIKLEILQKITFKNVTIDPNERDLIIKYVLDILSQKQITLQDKNRAYNIVAYLASIYGKQPIMFSFEKLNTMITMSMQKIIDKKLLMIQAPKKEEDIPICQHCGIVRQSFKDSNLYDLHCFKECKYLIPCKYCNQVVQIPQLNKHYVETCQQRNIFKQCEECNEVIMKIKQQQHKKQCKKQLSTKCPLCGERMAGKLKLKEHILKNGCPNNPR